MNPFALGLLAAASIFAMQRARAADVPIPYNPNSVEYKQISRIGTWQPLTGATPGGGGVIFTSPGVTDVQPKVVENLRLSQAGNGVSAAGSVKVPVGDAGKAAQVAVKAPITRAAFIRGAARAMTGPVGTAVIIGAPILYNWLKSQGIGINTGPDFLERPFTLKTQEAVCPAKTPSDYNQPTPPGASWVSKSMSPGTCEWGWLYPNGYYSGVSPTLQSTNVEGEPRPATVDEVASRVEAPDAPAITPQAVNEGVKNGIDPFGAQGPEVTTSGPSSVPGARTTKSEQVQLQPNSTTIAPSGSTNTQPGTQTTTTTTNHNITYNDNKVTHNTTTTTTTNITNNITNQTTTEAGPTETKENDTPEEEAPTDTPLGDIPKLYERKYPDGLVGIWNQKSEQIKQTSTFTLAEQLMPTSLTSGSCPAWVIPLNFASWAGYGEHDFAPPCWIWDVAKTIIIISALMLARALIFGG